MAKIPRLNYGDRPSAVPGGALPNPRGAAAMTDAIGNLVDVGGKIAADEENTEAARLREILKAKQEIVDTTEAGRRAGDFEEDLVTQTEALKQKFYDAPDQAPEQLLAAARVMADRQIEAAPNTAVGLDLAQKTSSRIDSAVREMHTWAQMRQTQKAKGDLDVTINRAASVARDQGSLPALGVYIAQQEAALGRSFSYVFGSDAPKRMSDLKTEIVRAWVDEKSVKAPLMVLSALSEKSGAIVDHLNTNQRAAARNDAIAGFERLRKTQELEVIKTGIARGGKLAEAFVANDERFARIAYAEETALVQQRKAIEAQVEVDTQALADAGVDVAGYDDKEVLQLIDDRMEYIKALKNANKRMTPFDAPDDPGTVEALLVQQDKALKAKTSKELGLIVKQQKDLAIAIDSKKISGATAATMFKNLALAVDTAVSKAEDPAGPNFLAAWRYPDAAGNAELSRQFARSPALRTDKAAQARIRLGFMGQFNLAKESGKNVDRQAAVQMALRAFALETGEAPEGLK